MAEYKRTIWPSYINGRLANSGYKNFQNEWLELARRFLEIDYRVDDLLESCKQGGPKNNTKNTKIN